MKTIDADTNYFRIIVDGEEFLAWKTQIRKGFAYFYCGDLKKKYKAPLISAESSGDSMTIVHTSSHDEYAIDRDDLQEI